jgi:hypothetical protein
MQSGGRASTTRLLVGGRAGRRRKCHPRCGPVNSGPVTWGWLDGAGRKEMTLKPCLGAKLSCRLGEEPDPREPDGLMPGRRTAGSREAGGGADCHAGLENAFVPAGGRRESRGSRGDGPEEQVQGQGRVLPALAVRNGTLGKPRLRADGFSQLKLGEKTEILYCNCNCDACWWIENG